MSLLVRRPGKVDTPSLSLYQTAESLCTMNGLGRSLASDAGYWVCDEWYEPLGNCVDDGL
jgi:hypothetical protein